MRVHRLIATACLLSISLLWGCGLSDPSKNVTETFNGTLASGISNTYPFSSGGTGEYAIRITALAPSTNLVLGVAFGQPNNGQCIVSTNNNFSTVGRDALSGAISKANYCLIVYDSGSVTGSVTYTVTVSHP